MKITIVTGPWLPVPAIAGGAVNRRWQGVAEEFAAKGHQVTICCRSYQGQPSQEVINGVKYIRQGGLSQSTNIYWDLAKDFVYGLTILPGLPSADITVINDFWLPIFAPLRSQLGKIVVNAARVPKGQYRFYKQVDRFVAVSHPIKNAIVRQYPPVASRTIVIPNPINTEVFYPSINQTDATRQEKNILYVGRIHPEKGIQLLLEAFHILSQSISNVKLTIIGPAKENQGGGGESYLSQLKEKARGLNVEFCNPIFEMTKLAEAYRSADLFCYPSLAEKGESFGVAPLEAMATGLVPIVSNLDCFQDFINEGKTGYFFNHRSSQAASNLSETLLMALKNWTHTQIMAKNAAETAKQYSYSAIADLYLEDFNYLLV